MQAISNEVVMRATFGDVDTRGCENLRVLLGRLTDWLNDSARLTLLATFGWARARARRRFREVMAPVEAALLAEVRRRRARRHSQRTRASSRCSSRHTTRAAGR